MEPVEHVKEPEPSISEQFQLNPQTRTQLENKKRRLNDILDKLGKEAQLILNKKNAITDPARKKEVHTEYKDKMREFKKVQKKIVETHNKLTGVWQRQQEERNERLRQNEIKRQEHKKRVEKSRAKRAFEGNVYKEFLEIQERYNELDNEELPSALFLHTDILQAYGERCPAIEKDTVDMTSKKTEWLRARKDQGAMYFNMLGRVYKRTGLLDCENVVTYKENEIEEFICSCYSQEQRDKYLNAKGILAHYKRGVLKSRKMCMDKKIAMNGLYELYKETGFPAHTYLADLIDLELVVHEPPDKPNCEPLLLERLYNLRKEYKIVCDILNSERRYINNTLRTLEIEMYNFLMDSQNDPTRQEGKYFTRWIHLTDDQKRERFNSFAHWHVINNFPNVTDIEQRESMIEQMTDLLDRCYKAKNIVYRDFRWQNKTGKISAVHVLNYDEERGVFYVTDSSGTKRFDNDTETETKRKKGMTSQLKTIFTKENEGVINDQVLTFLTKKDRPQKKKKIRHDLEKSLKRKLEINKLLPEDKKKIWERFVTIKKEVDQVRNDN